MTDKINDGGSAFPIPNDDRPGAYPAEPGMTLRDWFAGQVLMAAAPREGFPDWQLKQWFGERTGLRREEIAARAAYAYADAMLKAREAQS